MKQILSTKIIESSPGYRIDTQSTTNTDGGKMSSTVRSNNSNDGRRRADQRSAITVMVLGDGE